jgi:hypothetical protein
MSDPTPIQYQSPYQPMVPADVGYLKALSICHYVYGGLQILFSFIFVFYIVMGFFFASGAMNPAIVSSGPGSPTTMPAPPPAAIGYIMAGFGAIMMLLLWTLGILTIISGRKIAARKGRIFSFVISGINCICFPLGTTLGVFTIIVLAKNSVKQLYDNPA